MLISSRYSWSNDYYRCSVYAVRSTICTCINFFSGHGTFGTGDNASMFASVAGQIEKTNKLISVIAVNARYSAEVGDVVVGRIIDVHSLILFLLTISSALRNDGKSTLKQKWRPFCTWRLLICQAVFR